jgi:hypothetical protein
MFTADIHACLYENVNGKDHTKEEKFMKTLSTSELNIIHEKKNNLGSEYIFSTLKHYTNSPAIKSN